MQIGEREGAEHDGGLDPVGQLPGVELTIIIVNTRKRGVEGDQVSYDQIVRLAFANPPAGQFVEITVVYRKGPTRDGALQPGQNVKIQSGMIFDVTATDKS